MAERGLAIPGTTAFVTGGASGIGLAIARALLAEGGRVVLADWNREWLDAALLELGDGASGMLLDVTDRDAWSQARDAVEADVGPVDILVNNAGIGPDLNRLAEMPPEHFDRLVAIKLSGTFNGIHTFVPGMRGRRRGHVVNTASMAGLTASPRLGAYTAAKFGVVGLSEVLRAELAEDGIGVSVLCPGLVATRLAETSELAGVRKAAPTPSAQGGIDPMQVARQVVAAIREDRPYVITHAEHRPFVERRMNRILAAFDDAAATTGEEN